MGLMMKRFQLKFASLIVVCCLVVSQRGFSEESHESSAPTRETRGKEPVATEFDKIIETLKGKITEGGTLVLSGTSSDETSRGASSTPNKSAAQSVTINIAAITDLKKALETVSSYAKKMKGCGDGSTDEVSIQVLKVLNQFINYLVKTDATGTSLSPTLDPKKINTFVVIVQNALAQKKTTFNSAKATFEKSDDEVSVALVSIAKILQNGSWDKKNIDSTQVENDPAIKAVKTVVTGGIMCVLDTVTPNPNPNSNPNQTAPPTIDPSAGASTFIPPQVIPNPATPSGSFNQNQFQEALDRLRRAEAERDAERNRADELAQRDPNERDNEQAIKALQGALNQAQRPNNSKGNSDRSEQGPQISPSLSIPPGQQAQIPQIPPFQPPPPQPFPLGALGQPSPQQPYQPSRFNDDIPQRPTVAQPDPSTAMLLQQLAQQNQMFQQQMMSRNPYLNNNGVSNVNGNALQNFNSGGPRFARGGSSSGPRILPGRFTGAATSGIQGRMGINPSARGPLPSRLNR